MLPIGAFIFLAAAAYAFSDFDSENGAAFSGDEDQDNTVTPPQDEPEDLPQEEEEPEEDTLDIVLNVDPVTGALDIEVGDEEDGQLFLLYSDSEMAFEDSESSGTSYAAQLIWVPAEVDLLSLTSGDVDPSASQEEIFEELGIEVIEEWDLGETAAIHDAETGNLTELRDTRVELPEITANRDITLIDDNSEEMTFPEGLTEIGAPDGFLSDPADNRPSFFFETDPTTGAIHVDVPEGGGSLVVLGIYYEQEAGGTAQFFDNDALLAWLPDGVSFDDFQDFEFVPYSTTIEEFEEIGGVVLQEFDLGFNGYDLFGYDRPPSHFDTRIELPAFTSNLEISYYLSLYDIRSYDELLESSEGLDFPFMTVVSTWETFANDRFQPEDGDVIAGNELDNDILSPRGDPTAVTIYGGAGQDTIEAGLNDTVVTNDDTEADQIDIAAPLSFGYVFDEVPVIDAGPEDTVRVLWDPDSVTSVLFYEVETEPGVTETFYHVVQADGDIPDPADIVTATTGDLTIEEFYATAGVQLLATGGLGSLDASDPANPVDTQVAPPSFEGVDGDFLEISLIGDAITQTTQIDILTTSTVPV